MKLLLLLLFSAIRLACFIPSPSSASKLSVGFYADSCPNAEMTVKNAVREASQLDPSLPAKLLRLLFHDCFVEGCDASVLIQGNETEMTDPFNESLGGFSIIDSIKRLLEVFCPGIVSCADIIALAARDSVEITGGPSVRIPTGRKDGRISSASNVKPNVVSANFTSNQTADVFFAKGLSVDDLVTLSGAHTIGAAHCSAFDYRLKPNVRNPNSSSSSSLDGNYAGRLIQLCARDDDSVVVSNDPRTPFTFDNGYYRNVVANEGLLESDSALGIDSRTRDRVMEFADDQGRFFEEWGVAFAKLSSIGAKDEDNGGEVRRICSAPN